MLDALSDFLKVKDQVWKSDLFSEQQKKDVFECDPATIEAKLEEKDGEFCLLDRPERRSEGKTLKVYKMSCTEQVHWTVCWVS